MTAWHALTKLRELEEYSNSTEDILSLRFKLTMSLLAKLTVKFKLTVGQYELTRSAN
jgi:hypothetical protein